MRTKMNHITIGIHVHAEPQRLLATLASIRANTRQAVELLLLPDGPDEATKATLATMSDIPQSATVQPLGPPACFNRLVTATDADVWVLLESGSLVGPGWLDHLLAPLVADIRYGLSGPSTNLARNEQCVFPNSGDTPAEVAHTAQMALQRFETDWRSLAPLFSLADFCYVVRREAVEAVGAADEAYGLGPCWEMDYSIRAERAGFHGVWAGAAYVHRAPLTARRRREETRHFATSKRRYQDKFCDQCPRRSRNHYPSHCHGDACQNFAPANKIRIYLPLPAATPAAKPSAVAAHPQTMKPSSTVSKQENAPLVSCIMPTRDRPAFALQSVRYFQRQNYPARELIIIDDGSQSLEGHLPDDPRIRYLRLPPGLSIGAKRNRGCELARGAILANWDDDDWYGADRLSCQVAPLLSGAADISGLTATIFFELTHWQFWQCSPRQHRCLFVEDVAGGTLVYHRHIWQKLARYPNRSLAEDAVFLQLAVRRGARLSRIPSNGHFLYLRHDHNSWSFICGQHVDPQGWQRIKEPFLPPADRAFYAAQSPAASVHHQGKASPPSPSPQPLVSCIMPTANRRPFVPQSIQYFLRQDYPNRELIVVDDGQDTVMDLMPSDPRIRYMRPNGKHTIGAKRNLACREAAGEIIVHWDDDDWMAPWRLRYQVESLIGGGVDICGLDKILYFDPDSGRSWQYIYPEGSKPWVAGNTLCYTKAYWRDNPFPNINVGEDTRFVWRLRSNKLLPLQDTTLLVALIHPGNISPKRTAGSRWHRHPLGEIQNLIGDDWSFYAHLLQDKSYIERTR